MELTDGTLRLAIYNLEKPFCILCDASNYGIGVAVLQKKTIWKNRVSVNKRSFIFYHKT